jgi:hypothetical protein
MALTLTQLEEMRDALLTAIGSGTLRVEFGERSLTYRSTVEMQAALVSIEREIEKLGGGPERPRQIVITPKGV